MTKKRPQRPQGNISRTRVCDCGDPECDKYLKKHRKLRKSARRPLSGMSRIEPIVTERPGMNDPIEFDASGRVAGRIPSSVRKQITKVLEGKSLTDLYSKALGLPSRVRRYVKKVWKLQDKNGADWGEIADELAPMANKILDHRVEVITYTGIAMSRESKKLEDDKLMKLSMAIAEADCLLTIYSHFFLPGVTATLTGQCVKIADGGKSGYILGGVVDVVDYGKLDSADRRKRRHEAEEDMRTSGWNMPRRDYAR